MATMKLRGAKWARRLLIGVTAVGTLVAAFIAAAPAAHAAGPGLALSTAEIGQQDTVTISYDATAEVGAKNWVGIYRHGVKPGGGSSSLDWRYAPDATGSFTWGPSTRDGWTQEASSIAAGDLDVYLLANDGYRVLAGPIALSVSANMAHPKPAVDGVSELKVLSLNLWKGASVIKNGIDDVAEVIKQTDADVAFLPERYDPALRDASGPIASALGYHQAVANDTGLVSRYPIVSSAAVGSYWTKAILDVNGTEVAVYGGHLEYRWYAEYLPRGYGPTAVGDWPDAYKSGAELDAPVTDVKTMLGMNEESGRPQAAAALVQDVTSEKAKGRLAVVGGDFNEPSSQDWTAATKDLFDHHGTVVPWQTTKTLIDGGLVDSYRQLYPDPVKNPGFTWPANNPNASVSSLTWAPNADERDRIDYIFFSPSTRLALTASAVVGPKGAIVRGQRVDRDSDDKVLTPDATWPSDHSAVLSTFHVCSTSCDTAMPTGPATGNETLTVSGPRRVGEAITVDGTGFAPGAEVTIELHSDPILLGTTRVDAHGVLHLSATVPASVPAGSHSIAALIDNVKVTSVPVLLTAVPNSGGPGSDTRSDWSTSGGAGHTTSHALANTGTDTLPCALLGTVGLLAGAGLILFRRRGLFPSVGAAVRRDNQGC